MPDRYSYRVSWSEEDNEYVGTCVEFPSLSHLAPVSGDALAGIQALVRDVVEDMRADGEPVPNPLSAKVYSGHFMTRVPSELHQRLAIEAAEQRVSLNRLVAARLSAPSPAPCVVDRGQRRSGPRRKIRQREMA